MSIVGIFLIFHFEAGYTEGIISALLAALLACLFTIFNSWQVKRHDPVLLSFYEMTGGWLGISIFLAAGGVLAIPGNLTPEITDLFYLFLLSTVCTAFAYVRSEEHTSVLQSLMRNSYAFFCFNKKTYTPRYNC